MSENISILQQTKHVDVRYHLSWDKFIRVIFVRTAENDADIGTKNLGGELHGKCSSKMIIETQNMEIEDAIHHDRKGVEY